MTEPLIQLDAGGRTHRGFQSVSINQSMESWCSSWSLGYGDGPDQGGRRVIIDAGDAVILAVDGKVVIDGYVDQSTLEYSEKSASRTASGRSRLGDLADCTAIGPRRWRNKSVAQIAKELADPYRVRVVVDSEAANEPLERFARQPTDTIASVIRKAAKLRALVCVDVAGELHLQDAGAGETRTRLRPSVVQHGQRTTNEIERFSDYIYRVQNRGGVRELHSVSDEGIRRHRVLSLLGWAPRGGLQKMAEAERSRRAGRGERVSYTVAGWTDDDDELWAPNTRVRVVDDRLGVDGVMLIERTQHTLSDGEYSTRLELVRPEAYDAAVTYPATERGGTIR